MIADLTFTRKTGQEITSVFDGLAALRIAVFRDFPYCYEGSVEYEKAYLHTYANSDRAFLFAAFDGDQMIGATTCIPLEDETAAVQQPFLAADYPVETIFYFGESILLPQYRGLGLGHRFFDEREAHAAGFGTFETTCFCAVERPADHPMRPAGYQPLDTFWAKRGYQKTPELSSWFSWQDVGETGETAKKMTYWTRKL